MTLIEQVWGTTNERIQTVGTLFIALSALFAVTLGLKVKVKGLFTFGCFAIGIHLIGLAMLRNAWTRWRHDDDSLILLKKRGEEGRVYSVALHAFGQRVTWQDAWRTSMSAPLVFAPSRLETHPVLEVQRVADTCCFAQSIGMPARPSPSSCSSGWWPWPTACGCSTSSRRTTGQHSHD